MKKSALFVALLICSAVVALVDLFYIVFAIVQFGIVASEQNFLSTSFESLSIFVAILNIALALFATLYLIIKLVLKKNI